MDFDRRRSTLLGVEKRERIKRIQAYYRTPCFQRTKHDLLQAQEPFSDIAAFLKSQAFVHYCQCKVWGDQHIRDVSFHPKTEILSEAKDALARRFLEALRDPSMHDQQEIMICFHGTRAKNISKILEHGLDPSLRRKQRRGPGEYFMKCPYGSLPYSRGSGQLLVFAVVLPLEERDSSIIVVENNTHQLPLGVLRFTEDPMFLIESRASAYTSASAQKAASMEPKQLPDFIDMTNCYAKNQAYGFPWSNVLLEDNRIGLKSNVDDQLVIQLGFVSCIKVR